MSSFDLSDEILKKLPKHFHFGTAAAAYQVEGAVNEGGRGPSIWDIFSSTPGKTRNGDTGAISVDHYHRFTEDFVLMRELNIKHYRFSIAWSRLFPMGSGLINQQGVDFYNRLLDSMLENGITPMATLYHWDLPQALQDLGGWENRDTVYRFQEYADAAFRAFGDRVKNWITHNEPWCVSVLGNLTGEHAPGFHDAQKALTVAHHVLLSHGLAVQTYRGLNQDGQIGITLNLTPVYAQTPGSDDDKAVVINDVFSNRWFLDPIFKAQYPKEMTQIIGELKNAISIDDLATIAQPIDFLGVNYYQPLVVRYDENAAPFYTENVTPQDRVTSMGWPISGDGLRDLLLRLQKDYGTCPFYITENGAAYSDQLEQGHVHDDERVHYLSDHVLAIAEAREQGVDVRGYYVWSFIDNFEWAWGYDQRFGIVYCDYATLQRYPKDSAWWYAKHISRHQNLHMY